MKASNLKKRRAQRLRGRPRDEDCERTESGRKSRARAPQEDPRKTALEARQRVYGVSAGLAADPRAETVLGRLNLDGVVTDSMYRAGLQYLGLYRAMCRAIEAPIGLAVSSGGCQPKDWETMGPVVASKDVMSKEQGEYTDRAVRAIVNFEVMKNSLSIEECGFPARDTTVNGVVLEDLPMPDCWRGILQHGLGILAKRMGIDKQEAA